VARGEVAVLRDADLAVSKPSGTPEFVPDRTYYPAMHVHR
jgi:hypothetical protein